MHIKVVEVNVSICITTFNKPAHLNRAMASIEKQLPLPMDYEWIVVDDGGEGTANRDVCRQYKDADYIRIDREPIYRNSAFARNVAWRMARGDIIITQSDDIEHQGNAIMEMLSATKPGTFSIASIRNVNFNTSEAEDLGSTVEGMLEHDGRKYRPILFLGAVWREDICKIGGCEETFDGPGPDDVVFSYYLHGIGLKPVWAGFGHHLAHDRPGRFARTRHVKHCKRLIVKASRRHRWCCRGGPWKYIPGVPVGQS